MVQENESIHYFVKGLFRGMAETAAIAELREELEGHIADRVADGERDGLSRADALARVIDSLGDLEELIETMTGRKKKVYINRTKLRMMLIGLAYGTLYMIAVGFWFADKGFAWSALGIAVLGWLGYAVPTAVAYAWFRRDPNRTALEPFAYGPVVTSALIGWATISVACWIVNIAFFGVNFFMEVLWAWMPTVGLFTWPLLEFTHIWLIRRQPTIARDER
jgi:hypothetical protein